MNNNMGLVLVLIAMAIGALSNVAIAGHAIFKMARYGVVPGTALREAIIHSILGLFCCVECVYFVNTYG